MNKKSVKKGFNTSHFLDQGWAFFSFERNLIAVMLMSSLLFQISATP